MMGDMNLQSKSRVLAFFDNEVKHYILGDIDRLTDEIRPDASTGLRGCTVPLALMLFAVIDLFGYLTRDDQAKPRKEDTQKNFMYLMSKDVGFFPISYHNDRDLIIKLFRHGLTHQFFPKAAGITKAGLGFPLVFEASGTLNLNVDVLSKDVRTALEKMRKRVAGPDGFDLVTRINSRLDQLAKEDYDTLTLLKVSKESI